MSQLSLMSPTMGEIVFSFVVVGFVLAGPVYKSHHK